MEEDLRPIMQEILNKYKIYKESERFLLFELSSQIYWNSRQSYPIPYPKPSSIPIIIPTVPFKPFTTYYISTFKNISAKEKESLEFLPYQETTSKVYYSNDLEVYKTNPFNQQVNQIEFIQNTQFFDYLVLSILKNYPIVNDWVTISNMFADTMNKSRRLLSAFFNNTIKKYVKTPEIELKKQEFRENFCQICMKYACSTHFYDERVEYESDEENLDKKLVKYEENAMLMIDPNHWKPTWWSNLQSPLKSGKWLLNFTCFNKADCYTTKTALKLPISNEKKQIIKKLLSNSIKNPCAISFLIKTPCFKALPYIEKYLSKYNPPTTVEKLSKKKIFYTNNFEYKPILTNVIETHCKCKSECSLLNKCPCIVGEFFNKKLISRRCCEKYCLCSTNCKIRFLGCNCQYGKCDNKTCVCWVNQRECDPLLCIFCVCIECVKNKPKDLKRKKRKNIQLCRNVKNSISLGKRTAMGESSIKGAGMGLFVLENCEKNEYITEYTGELIREAESERRAAVYDYRHHSYIFSLSPDTRWSIDSTYFGSKMRYVNHKSHNEHNAFSQVWSVNGELKILLFAAEKLVPMQELFFDYGYDAKEIKYEWLQEYEKRFKIKKK